LTSPVNHSVSQAEAESSRERVFRIIRKTGSLRQKNLDFVFATSVSLFMICRPLKVGKQGCYGDFMYPKEGNPLWEEYFTKGRISAFYFASLFRSLLLDYSLFPKPYAFHWPKNQGMGNIIPMILLEVMEGPNERWHLVRIGKIATCEFLFILITTGGT